jgi:spore maturation protein CgeB
MLQTFHGMGKIGDSTWKIATCIMISLKKYRHNRSQKLVHKRAFTINAIIKFIDKEYNSTMVTISIRLKCGAVCLKWGKKAMILENMAKMWHFIMCVKIAIIMFKLLYFFISQHFLNLMARSSTNCQIIYRGPLDCDGSGLTL